MEVNVKIEDSFSNNPWYVEDATAFLKFCCPECDYQIPDLQLFSDHAVCNHEKSTVLFGTENTNKEMFIKEEYLEVEQSYEDSNIIYEDLLTYPQNEGDETNLPIKQENPSILLGEKSKIKKRKGHNEGKTYKRNPEKTLKHPKSAERYR